MYTCAVVRDTYKLYAHVCKEESVLPFGLLDFKQAANPTYCALVSEKLSWGAAGAFLGELRGAAFSNPVKTVVLTTLFVVGTGTGVRRARSKAFEKRHVA